MWAAILRHVDLTQNPARTVLFVLGKGWWGLHAPIKVGSQHLKNSCVLRPRRRRAHRLKLVFGGLRICWLDFKFTRLTEVTIKTNSIYSKGEPVRGSEDSEERVVRSDEVAGSCR